jgi:1-acyl-sn-glycerol-3-phosphate acyltransferase
MQNIVITKPYRFVPPRFSPFWARIVQWYLPTYLRKSFGITSWECVGADRLTASLEAGSGVLLASNHCRPCDPMVLGLLARETARSFHVMASWHLFMQNRVQSFLLPRIGGFSVYREGLDRESLKCATHILAEARFPLAIFPEGFVTRNNDRLLNLMDGTSFLARSAAKQRPPLPAPARSCCICFHSLLSKGDLVATRTGPTENRSPPVLVAAESAFLRGRIVKAGYACWREGNGIPRRLTVRRRRRTVVLPPRSSSYRSKRSGSPAP